MVENVWQQFLSIANKEIGSRAVETWFKAISLYEWNDTDNTAYLYAPNQFVRDWIYNNYLEELKLHLSRLLCVNNIKIILSIQQKTTSIVPVVSPKENNSSLQSVAQKIPGTYNLLKHEYQFNSFIVDKKNEFTYLAAQAVINNPGSLYSPLLICGSPGLGKTHLLHAIGNQYLKNNKTGSVICSSIDGFIKDYITSVRTKSMQQFNKKYDSADLLLLDDLQDIAHKKQSQNVLCNIVSNLFHIKKQIVFSSSHDPLNLEGITDKLKSRLSSGLITYLFPPTFETKIRIIKRKLALEYNLTLSDEIIHFLAHKNIHGPREIDGMLVKITAIAALTNQPISLNFIKDTLDENVINQHASITLNIDNILIALKKEYGLVSTNDLLSKNRNPFITKIRHIGIYLTKTLLKKSLRYTAQLFGNRDYTTIKHAVDKISSELTVNNELRKEVNMLKNKILMHEY